MDITAYYLVFDGKTDDGRDIVRKALDHETPEFIGVYKSDSQGFETWMFDIEL